MGEKLFIGIAVISIINGCVLLAVNPRRNVNQIFLLTSICAAMWAFGTSMAIKVGETVPLQQTSLIFWLRFSAATGTFLGWSAWLMRNALLNEKDSLFQTVRRSWFFLAVAILAAGIVCTDWYIPSESTPTEKLRGFGFTVYTVIVVGSCLWMLYDAFRHLGKVGGVRRIEMQFFVVGIISACLLLLLSNLAGDIPQLSWLKQISPLWFLLLHTTAVWVLCYYRIFDAKHVVVSIGRRILLVASMSSLAALLFQWRPVAAVSNAGAIFLTTLTSCIVVLVGDKYVSFLSGRSLRTSTMTFRRLIIDWARNYSDENNLKQRFTSLLHDKSQARKILLLTNEDQSFEDGEVFIDEHWSGFQPLCKEGWITRESLRRRNNAAGSIECELFLLANEIQALIAVPRGSPKPSLVLGFGERQSLRPYDYHDIQVLLELGELMDNILTHSRVSSQAIQMEKMEAAAMISRGLAHDLRNLCTPVSTLLSFMEKKTVANSPEAQVLDHAKQSIGMMQSYIHESLLFARRLKLKLIRIQSDEIILMVGQATNDQAKCRNIKVSFCFPKNFTFFGDLTLITRLLQNLVSNGIEASPSNGTVELWGSYSDQGNVIFEVNDEGPGVPSENQNRIFEPYFTTKDTGNETRGLGLGLAICRKIVDLHRGQIGVSRTEDGRTSFRVILPIAPPLQESHPARTAKESVMSWGFAT